MSSRTLIELNHDLCPPDRLLDVWAKQMQVYMRSGDRAELPYGVTFKHMRHHSEPCPLAGVAPQPKTWPQIKAETIEKYEDLFQEQAAKIAELESMLAGAAALPSAQNPISQQGDSMKLIADENENGSTAEMVWLQHQIAEGRGEVRFGYTNDGDVGVWLGSEVNAAGAGDYAEDAIRIAMRRELPSPPIPSKEKD